MSSVDEISIKKFIITGLRFFAFILKRWYVILLVMILLGSFNFYQISKIKETYPAKIKLFVRPQNVAKENKLLLQVYAQVISSRNLLEEVFFEKNHADSSGNLLINQYLNTYFEFNPEGLDSEIPKGFQLRDKPINELNIDELLVLDRIMDKVLTPVNDYSDGFISVSADYDLGFITINVSTPTADLSMFLLDRLYNRAKDLLIQTTSYPYRTAYTNLKEETDSLSTKYKETYYQLNIYRDRRIRKLKKDSIVSKDVKYLEKQIYKNEAEAEVCKLQYLESLEQLKVAQLEMNHEALLLHEVERTHRPIEAFQPCAKIAAIKGGILGVILGIVLLFLFQILLNIKKELE